MRHWCTRRCLLTVLMTVLVGTASGEEAKNDQVVLEAETEWFKAVRTGSADSMSSLLADGFVGISDVGRKLERDDWIAQYSHESSRALRNFSVRNQQVRVQDGIAVVTGEVQYSRPRGFYVTAYTHVWRNFDSKWRMISLQEEGIN